MIAGSWVAIVLLVLAAAISTWRAVRRSTLGDRTVALDTITSIIQCGLFAGAVITGDGILIDLALVLGLLGFLTSVTVARFLERTGA